MNQDTNKLLSPFAQMVEDCILELKQEAKENESI